MDLQGAGVPALPALGRAKDSRSQEVRARAAAIAIRIEIGQAAGHEEPSRNVRMLAGLLLYPGERVAAAARNRLRILLADDVWSTIERKGRRMDVATWLQVNSGKMKWEPESGRITWKTIEK